MLDGHGDNIHQYHGRIKANFSSNVWYGAMPDAFYQHLQDQITNTTNYPSPTAESLTVLIEQYYNLELGSCIVTNGATEAFYLIAHLFQGKSSIIGIPSFAEYEDACSLHGHSLEFEATKNVLDSALDKFDLVWLCNPNNPDGHIYPVADILLVLNRFPSTTFVVDEAYIEFTHDVDSVIPYVQEYPNLIVVRSMTKKYSIPGLRLGYIIASPQIIASLLRYKMPWSVNALAIAAGEYVFQNNRVNPSFYIKDALFNSAQLQGSIDKIPGIAVHKNNCTFFLIELSGTTSAEMQIRLIEKYGILVRDASNFRGLSPYFIRIAVQSQSDNALLLNALAECINAASGRLC